MFMSKEEQYYETLQLFARNINNKLNNIVLVMNRCHERPNKLRERTVENNTQEKISPLNIARIMKRDEFRSIIENRSKDIRES